VAVPLKTRNEVLIGKISGNYEYRWLTNFISHIRKIMWLKKISKEELEEEYDVDFNSSETLYPIKADLQKLSTLVGTKSLESLIGELSFVIEDLDLMKERMLELVHRLAETEEISEVREITEEMEKILKEK
jgi:predicted Mrr-cat superfamily restriction endonuclease